MIAARRKTTFREDLMLTFMLSMNWTDQGIKNIKDAPKRVQAGRDLAKKVGVEIKHLYLTGNWRNYVPADCLGPDGAY
jgi:uncharacterized protein with GYD domain